MALISAAWRTAMEIAALVLRIVTAAIRKGVYLVEDWLLGDKKAQYGIAVTRILLGITAIGLLLSDWRTRYYFVGSGSAWNGQKSKPTSPFAGNVVFDLFRDLVYHDIALTAIMALLIVLATMFTLGWHTRLIGIIFFVLWVSFIALNRSLGNQGDNIMRIALLLVLFTESASVWSMDARRQKRLGRATTQVLPSWLSNVVHNVAIVLLIVQICIVYTAGGLYKAAGEPWQNGTAVYGPLSTMRYSPWPELNELFVSSAPLVLQATWTSVLLQAFFAMMLLRRLTRVLALIGIGSFHVGIGILMGLPWFSLSMLAIDSVLIRDKTWKSMSNSVTSIWRSNLSQETKSEEQKLPIRTQVG